MAGPRADPIGIKQLLEEAKTRWLRPLELLNILQNYQAYDFGLNLEPPVKPEGGSLYLFDRRVVRYFRRDGHNWRKKPDGKTVKEAHEKLKVGNRDTLHCYYAHSEDNDRFRRRVYWLLEGPLENIVLVHYLVVEEGTRCRFRIPVGGGREPDPIQDSENDSDSDGLKSEAGSASVLYEGLVENGHSRSDLFSHPLGIHSNVKTEMEWPAHTQHHRQGSNEGILPSFQELLNEEGQTSAGRSSFFSTSYSGSQILENSVRPNMNGNWNGTFPEHQNQSQNPEDLSEWRTPSIPVQFSWPGVPLSESATMADRELQRSLGSRIYLEESSNLGSSGKVSGLMSEKEDGISLNEVEPEPTSAHSLAGGVHPESHRTLLTGFDDLKEVVSREDPQLFDLSIPVDPIDIVTDVGDPYSYIHFTVDHVLEEMRSTSLGKCSSRGNNVNNLENFPDIAMRDSFGDWSVERNGGDQPQMVESKSVRASLLSRRPKENYMEEPSEIVFNVADFVPPTCSTKGGTKIIIVGTTETDESRRWGVLFDNVEVSATVVRPGVLCCIAPPHVEGKVTFAVTAFDEKPCSKLLQMEYSNFPTSPTEAADAERNEFEQNLQIRLVRLLLHSQETETVTGIKSMEDEEEWLWLEKLVQEEARPRSLVQEQLLMMLLRRQLAVWTRGPMAEERIRRLDDCGLGAIHMVSALGYAWAIPLLTGMVGDVDLLDNGGRTALHWAAACGREQVVVKLLAAGASPALVAHPKMDQPGGATPADLAAGSGHKGIAAYLAKIALNRSFSSMSLQEPELTKQVMAKAKALKAEPAVSSLVKADKSVPRIASELDFHIRRIAELTAHKASLIKAAFQVFSLRRRGVAKIVVKQEKEVEANDEFGLTEEEMMTIASMRKVPATPSQLLHDSARNIQRQYRGWKGRKNFLEIRRRIIQIQAHVKGHLVRKHYNKLRWAIGILEKVILRWRRKRQGLRFLDHLPDRGMPAEVRGTLVVQRVSPEEIPRNPPIPDRLDEKWRDVGGKNAGLETAVERMKELLNSASGKAQYTRLCHEEVLVQAEQRKEFDILSE